jgi:hypothetical protein
LQVEAVTGPWERLLDDEADLVLHRIDKSDARLEWIDLGTVSLVPVVAPGFLPFPSRARVLRLGSNERDSAPPGALGRLSLDDWAGLRLGLGRGLMAASAAGSSLETLRQWSRARPVARGANPNGCV